MNYGAVNWEGLFVLVSDCTFIYVGFTGRLALLEFILSANELLNAKMLYVSPHESKAMWNITFIGNWVSETYSYCLHMGTPSWREEIWVAFVYIFKCFIIIFYALQPWQLWYGQMMKSQLLHPSTYINDVNLSLWVGVLKTVSICRNPRFWRNIHCFYVMSLEFRDNVKTWFLNVLCYTHEETEFLCCCCQK